MRRDGSVVGLGHPRDQPHFGDAPGVTQVGLQHRRRVFLQHFAKTPFGEDALTRGDGQVGRAGDIGHHVVVLRLARLLDEHRGVGLHRLDQHLREGRRNRSVEIHGDIDVRTDKFAEFAQFLTGVLHFGRRLDIARRAAFSRAGLEGRESLRDGLPDVLGIVAAGMGVDANLVPRRAAEQLIHRHAEPFALDVPQRLVDAAQRRGQDRPAAVERVPVNRLPVVHHGARILAHQVWLNFLDRRGASQGAAFGDRLAQPDDLFHIRVDLQKQPARLDQEGLQLGDSDGVPWPDRRILGDLLGACFRQHGHGSRDRSQQRAPADGLCVAHVQSLPRGAGRSFSTRAAVVAAVILSLFGEAGGAALPEGAEGRLD